MNGVATTALPIAALLPPMAAGEAVAGLSQLPVTGLDFPNLLDEMVASISADCSEESVPQTDGNHPVVRERGVDEALKTKKAEHPAESTMAAALGLMQQLAAAPPPMAPVPPLAIGIPVLTVPAEPAALPLPEPAVVSAIPAEVPKLEAVSEGAGPVPVQPPEKNLKVAAQSNSLPGSPARVDVRPALIAPRPPEPVETTTATPRRREKAAGEREKLARAPETNRAVGEPDAPPPVETAVKRPLEMEPQSAPIVEGFPGAASAPLPKLSSGAPEAAPARLAFSAKLAALATTQEDAVAPPVAVASPAVPPERPDQPGPAIQPAEPAEAPHSVARVRKPEAADDTDRDPTPERQQVAADAPARMAPPTSEAPASQPRAPEPHRLETAPPRAAEPAHPVTVRPPAVEPVARDIRLELTGTGQRIQVRLEERAGEVRVSVHTPDGPLAETLRDHLPSLSARLEQTGFRADEWRAADGPAATRPLEVQRPSSGGVGDRRDQSGNGGQSSQEQGGRQRDSQNHRNQKGKSFAWLMSSSE